MKKIAYFLGCLTLVACKNDTDSSTENPAPELESVVEEQVVEKVEKEAFPYDQKFNDLALFLSGSEGEKTSGLKSLEAKKGWQQFSKEMDQNWTKTNEKLATMQEWSATELADINTAGGTLFYPFSGPDFLHADVFFHEHDHIVMVGLEPIGTYPDMQQKAAAGTDSLYLTDVRKSLRAILGLSFFRTIAMAEDFSGEMDGTLPVLMQFMSRMGNEVMFHEVVAILPNGELTTELENIADSTYLGNRFYYRKNGTEDVKTLTYFAANLQNVPYVSRGGLVAKGLESRTDMVNYFNSLDIKSTYLKSASYLMHRPTFSIIRDIILNESEAILEDDSGIPVQYFDPENWELTFYGDYKFPISLFAERHQEDLKEIYEGDNIHALPFGIGYQYRKGASNLMKAVKKK